MDLETHRELYKPNVTVKELHNVNKLLDYFIDKGITVYKIDYIVINGDSALAIITHSKTAL